MSETTASRLAVWRTRVDYQGIILGVICAVVTLSLLVGDRSTAQMIAARQMEDRLASLAEVLPPSLYDNNPLHDAVRINDAALSSSPVEVYPARKQGVLTGAALQLGTIGYGGNMSLIVGVDAKGNILGVRVLSHKETPGLADKIELGKSNWILSFNGSSLDNTTEQAWHVKKDGGKFDQFTGATITPRAIVGIVHKGLEFYLRHRGELAAAPPTSGSTVP